VSRFGGSVGFPCLAERLANLETTTNEREDRKVECENCGQESDRLVYRTKYPRDTPEDKVFLVCPDCTGEDPPDPPEPRHHPVFDGILKTMGGRLCH
jgi:hypothetical protein